ncbi:ABC transporter permease [Anaerosalibacter massiliensis]|uniref:ABC transporter permease n=1 Tax=Anaerosalibacter massiliensis TaxID=1347392 RepID=A0A9X2MG91_9FIRM|nr:ABC transporter permease [Anaerosalibacter massiliensis]MCR2043119.1 ABC transporter permease [Anaerosalibacter massiliensis]
MEGKRLKFTIISVFVGLLVGAFILLAVGFNPLEAYGVMIRGILGKPKYISWTIIQSTPLILTGISVAFAFRTGLFNIGAEGQFIIGALVATLVGYFWNLPPILHAIVAMLMACLAAAIWAGLAGILKSKFGVNEVITTIMLNWIALYLSNAVVFWDQFKRPNSEASYNILESASIRFPKTLRSISDFFRAPVNWGFIIAILVAILIRHILKNTTLGYQLRAVGFNSDAAEYGGIDVKRNIVISMAIAGALSGLAGAVHVLGVTEEVAVLAAMEGNGFDGIAVSLIAGNNAIGCIFAGLLFGALKYGGYKIQPAMGAPSEIISIVIGTIVFFISMPKLIEMLTTLRAKRKRGGEVESK